MPIEAVMEAWQNQRHYGITWYVAIAFSLPSGLSVTCKFALANAAV